jgi:hypothetical protein
MGMARPLEGDRRFSIIFTVCHIDFIGFLLIKLIEQL